MENKLELVNNDQKEKIQNKYRHRFEKRDGNTIVIRQTKEGEKINFLSNFVAKIVEVIERDEGFDSQKILVIEGTSSTGEKLNSVRVPVEQFSSLNWILPGFGPKAIVSGQFSVRGLLTEAIQVFSEGYITKRILGFTGWTGEKENMYVTSNGGLSSSGLNDQILVDLGSGPMKHYSLPVPPSGGELKKAILHTLKILDLGPKRLSTPMLASIFRAPLCSFLPTNFIVFFVGTTGVGKTALTSVIQSHFGSSFTFGFLPGNWSSTSNSLEYMAYKAKDVIFVIDDFAPPSGDRSGADRLNREAVRFIRNLGNHAGRDRLRADITLRPKLYSRGLVVSSGEDLPRGQSILARGIFPEVHFGDMNWEVLTQLQNSGQEGVLASTTSAFVTFLASQPNDLAKTLKIRHQELRNYAFQDNAHKRTPDLQASLMLGIEWFINFANEAGLGYLPEIKSLWKNSWEALTNICENQNNSIQSQDPTIRFFEIIKAGLQSNKIFLANAIEDDSPPSAEVWGWVPSDFGFKSTGEKIGWVSSSEVWLIPDVSYSFIVRQSQAQGAPVTMTQNTMWRRLSEKGKIIKSFGEKKNLCKRTPFKQDRKRVAVFSMSEFWDPEKEAHQAPNAHSNEVDSPGLG